MTIFIIKIYKNLLKKEYILNNKKLSLINYKVYFKVLKI